MGHYGPVHQLHPTVWTWGAPLEALPVSAPLPCSPATEVLLLHPCVNCPQLEDHGLGFCDFSHQSNPTEEFNKDIDGPLEPLRVPQSDESVFRINQSHTTYQRHPEPFMNGEFVLNCKWETVSNLSVHCQIEECTRGYSPQCPSGCSELWSMESVLASDYLLARPYFRQ